MTLSFPAANNETVTQAHTDYCASKGHATHTVAGEDTGLCPRCGERKTSTQEAVKFARIAKLTRNVTDLKFSLNFTGSDHSFAQMQSGIKAQDAELNALFDSMDLSELARYGQYRKAH